MPPSEQSTRLAHVMGWIRTAKENLPAINHGRNAVTPEQIARLSALLDRMHRRALVLVSQTAAQSNDAGSTAAGRTEPVLERATAGGRRAA